MFDLSISLSDTFSNFSIQFLSVCFTSKSIRPETYGSVSGREDELNIKTDTVFVVSKHKLRISITVVASWKSLSSMH